MQSISHLRRIPQMIELLNSGDTEEPVLTNAGYECSWDRLVEDVVTRVTSDANSNGYHIDGDCTMMEDD